MLVCSIDSRLCILLGLSQREGQVLERISWAGRDDFPLCLVRAIVPSLHSRLFPSPSLALQVLLTITSLFLAPNVN